MPLSARVLLNSDILLVLMAPVLWISRVSGDGVRSNVLIRNFVDLLVKLVPFPGGVGGIPWAVVASRFGVTLSRGGDSMRNGLLGVVNSDTLIRSGDSDLLAIGIGDHG